MKQESAKQRYRRSNNSENESWRGKTYKSNHACYRKEWFISSLVIDILCVSKHEKAKQECNSKQCLKMSPTLKNNLTVRWDLRKIVAKQLLNIKRKKYYFVKNNFPRIMQENTIYKAKKKAARILDLINSLTFFFINAKAKQLKK